MHFKQWSLKWCLTWGEQSSSRLGISSRRPVKYARASQRQGRRGPPPTSCCGRTVTALSTSMGVVLLGWMPASIRPGDGQRKHPLVGHAFQLSAEPGDHGRRQGGDGVDRVTGLEDDERWGEVERRLAR